MVPFVSAGSRAAEYEAPAAVQQVPPDRRCTGLLTIQGRISHVCGNTSPPIPAAGDAL